MPTMEIQNYGAEATTFFIIIFLGKKKKNPHSGFLCCRMIKTIHFQNESLCFRKLLSFQEHLLALLAGDASVSQLHRAALGFPRGWPVWLRPVGLPMETDHAVRSSCR